MPIPKSEDNLKKGFCEIIKCALKIILSPTTWNDYKDKIIKVDIPVAMQTDDLGDRLLQCCREILPGAKYGWEINESDAPPIDDNLTYGTLYENWFKDLL